MADGLAGLKDYVGRTMTATDIVTAAAIGRLAATFGIQPPAKVKGDPLPPGWHGPFFTPMHGPQNMREDGQPAGGFMPRIDLPIQRLRGESTRFPGTLHIGDEMSRTTEIAALDVDEAVAGGPVVSALFRQTIENAAGPAVIEERHFLYFGLGYVLDTAVPNLPAAHDWERVFDPDPVTMFRYSAIRFNSHRIHYDRRYTVEKEGHPGLVVQGTLVSHLLIEMAHDNGPGAPLSRFDFRIHKPIYDTGPFTIRGAMNADGRTASLWAIDPDGVLSMTADAYYGEAGN